ncbi:MAG: hypothetical protein U1A78_40270 [Polyangia bacterium]
MLPKIRRGWSALLLGAALQVGCPQHPPAPASAADASAAGVQLDPAQDYALVLSQHETIGDAATGLGAALKLTTDLPLPFPRVERRGDRFRVLGGRGKGAQLAPVLGALKAAGVAVQVEPAAAGGGDDVVRLGIVCTDGTSAPLYAELLPRTGSPREQSRIPHGQVVVPTEDDDGDSDEGSPSAAAERGLVKVLRPAVGLMHEPDVLFPADCTPRDEDNDDGNGRLLAGGRLCLTTRHSGGYHGPGGARGSVAASASGTRIPRADLLAVSPSYRRCLRIPGAGTFDGFDHNQSGTQFAVEDEQPAGPAAGPAGGSSAGAAAGSTPAPATTLRIYTVGERGEPVLRGELPDLIRPAYLGDTLVAVRDAGGPPELVALDRLGARAATDPSPLPKPRALFALPAQGFVRLVPKAPLYRPAAPTLHEQRAHVTFQLGCRPDAEKRVRAAAGKRFVQCLMETEVEVGLDGTRPERRCRLDNVDNSLDEPLPTPCT